MALSSTYTKRFYYGTIPGSSTITLFTVPSGNEYVITDITMSAHGATGLNVKLAISPLSAQPWVYSSAGSTTVQWSGRAVVQAGESMVGQTQTAVQCDLSITGYVFPA